MTLAAERAAVAARLAGGAELPAGKTEPLVETGFRRASFMIFCRAQSFPKLMSIPGMMKL